MVPAEQRLDACHRAGHDVHLRLVLEDQLVALDGAAQVVGECEALGDPDLQFVGVELVVVAAVRFRLVHRGVGLLQQRLGVGIPEWVEGCADAGGHEDLGARERNAHGEFAQQLVEHHLELFDARQILDQDGELIAAQAPDGVLAAQAPFEALADLLQELVAGRVAERVVDVLEVVEVDEEQRQQPFVPARALHGLGQPVAEQIAIGQARQRIELRERARSVLRLLAPDLQGQPHYL